MRNMKHWTEKTSNLWTTIKTIEQQHDSRIALNDTCGALYYRRPEFLSVRGRHDSIYKAFCAQGDNLVREIVDGFVSMVARPTETKITPIGADFRLDEAIDNLNDLVRGIKHVNKYEKLKRRIVRDGSIYDLGVLLVSADPETGEMMLTRGHPNRFLWDLAEEENISWCAYKHYFSKRVLKAKFPGFAKEIDDLPLATPDRVPGIHSPNLRNIQSDQVCMVEAWSTNNGTKKGKHVWIGSKDFVPVDTDRDTKRLPVALYRHAMDDTGIGGVSLVRQVAINDLENQATDETVRRALKIARAILWIKQGAAEKFAGIAADMDLQVQEYEDEIPEIKVPQVVSKELLERAELKRSRAYSETGLNPNLAQGGRPGNNLDSEPSIRAAVETSAIRLIDAQGNLADFDEDVERATVQECRLTYQDKEAVVRAPGTRLIRKIKWNDINLSEDQYEYETNAKSNMDLTFSGKLAQLNDIKKLGLPLDPAEAYQLMNLPDLRGKTEELNAPLVLAQSFVYQILRKNQPVTPPKDEEVLRHFIRIGKQQYYTALKEAQTGEVDWPAENIERMRKAIEQAQARMGEIAPAQPSPEDANNEGQTQ